MGFGIFLFLLSFIVLILLMVGVFPTKHLCDASSPLNYFMYAEPSVMYTNQIVSEWVEKPWRMDDSRIPCRLEEAYDESVSTKDRKLFIYSHGNAENLALCMPFAQSLSEHLNVDVVSWDYSGYGLNEADKYERTPDGVNESLITIVEHFRNKGYEMDNIILCGYSLGTGPSMAAASTYCIRDNPPAAVVLFAPYSSILDVVAEKVGSERVKDMFDERWNNVVAAKSVTVPLFMIHGQRDNLIKVHHSQKILEASNQGKLEIVSNTGHNTLQYSETIGRIKLFLESNDIL
jgi:pimeloyl-ACP methyl ester carboxylesterase